MKHHWILFLIFLAAASPASGQTRRPAMMRGARLGEVKPPAMTIVVGTNETVGSIAEPGWPIIVSAAMLSEKDPPPAAPANLKVKVTDEKDKAVTLAFEPGPRPAAGNGVAQLFWLVPESATRALAPGRYHITFEPVAGLAIESGDLRVVETNPERAASLGLLRIQHSLLLGQEDDALAEADRLTTADAKNEDAWIAKGDILLMKDQPDEALEAYDSALEQHQKAGSEPLFILERRRAAFFRSLEKRGVLPPDKPAP